MSWKRIEGNVETERRGKSYKGRQLVLESVKTPSWRRGVRFSPCSTPQLRVPPSPRRRRPKQLYSAPVFPNNTEQSPQTLPLPSPTKLYIVARLCLYQLLTLLHLTVPLPQSHRSSTKLLLPPKRRPRSTYSIALYKMNPEYCRVSQVSWPLAASTLTHWSFAVPRCQT